MPSQFGRFGSMPWLKQELGQLARLRDDGDASGQVRLVAKQQTDERLVAISRRVRQCFGVVGQRGVGREHRRRRLDVAIAGQDADGTLDVPRDDFAVGER